jgi:hypothetical protein
MRRWGIVISLVYALIVIGLLTPLVVWLAGTGDVYGSVIEAYAEWSYWLIVVVLVGAEAMLLFLPVDATEKRLKPRGPVARSVFVASLLFLFMTVGVFGCIGVVIYSDRFFDKLPSHWWPLASLAGIWAAWGMVFWLYLRGKTGLATRVVNWLLRGSVLELLIAVPSHVWVRRRNDCSAPLATSFGIVTGIAVMLLSFGPSVLLLYKRRLQSYRTAGRAPAH